MSEERWAQDVCTPIPAMKIHPENEQCGQLHILLVTTSYPLKKGQASGVFVKRLAEALSNQEKLIVLTPGGRSPSAPEESRPPVQCFRYAPWRWQQLAHEPGGIPVALKQNPWLWLLVPVFLMGMFISVLRRGRRTQIIHANWAMTGLICGLAGKLLGKPVITTLRGSDVGNLEHSPFKRSILRLILRLNAFVVTVSTPMQGMLRQLFPGHAGRCLHIPNGVDGRFLALPFPEADSQKLRLVSIGSLIPRKDFKSIINAMQELPDMVTLTIIGEGPEQTALERLARELELSDRIIFRGGSAPEAIPDVLEAHDALILASHAEGRPNVVVEAMAAGRTVLASRLPGIAELIRDGHNGLLFEPGNPASIAESVQQLLAHPEKRRALGEAARQTVIDLGLNWPACARQYRQIYLQALRGHL